jgi:hypothetical protein
MSQEKNPKPTRKARPRPTEQQNDSPPAGSGHYRLELRFPPLWRTLTAKDVREIIGELRYPNDPESRKELLSGPITLSPRDILILTRVDQLQDTLNKLDRMEKHYSEVATLDASETQRRLAAASADDRGALAYRCCLADNADPRLAIAKRILALIPIARRHLQQSKPALELTEISALNQRASMLLITPHLKRGLKGLAAVSEGGRRKNSGARDLREERALSFKEAKKTNPGLTRQQFVDGQSERVSVRTLQRGLKDLADA